MSNIQPTRVFALAFVLCWGAVAAAQSRPLPRIGVLANTVPIAELVTGTSPHPAISSLVAGLRERGWVDGKNMQLVWRSAEGDLRKLPALAEQMVRQPVDVLVAYGPGGDAAMMATDRIPIVLATSGVSGRLVVDGKLRIASLARPGGNVTGLTLVSASMGGKYLELLKQAAPRVRRVAFLTDEPIVLGPAIRAAAGSLGLTLESFAFESLDRLETTYEAVARTGIDGVIVGDLPAFHLLPTQRRLHSLAERHQFAVLHLIISAANSGGLMAYGPDINRLYQRAPYFIDRILRGAKPGEIPIEQPMDHELRVNIRAAKALRLTLPSPLILQATQAIE